MRIVICGLTITSSWGNGHATTYRSLVKALRKRGHSTHFIEKDVEWYRSNRDMPAPEFCQVTLYDDWQTSARSLLNIGAEADVIVIGSYFPDSIALTREFLAARHGPVLFYDIDTPITMARLQVNGGTEYLDPTLIPHYAAYLSFTGGPTLAALQERFGSPLAVPFYCSVDPEMHKPSMCNEAFRCDMSYLGTYASDRQQQLMTMLDASASLLPERQFLVAGPQYPDDLQWRRNVRRIIHVSPPEHPAFYSSSRFTLNLTRTEMVAAGFSPSVRLFEASACGAAILSDYWAGMEEFLTPGEEVLIPKDQYEVASILKCMSDQERLKTGRRARERILAEHTSEHRAKQFESIVEQVS